MTMDTLTEQQKQIVAMIRDFVKRDIEPVASDVGLYPDNYTSIDDVETARKVLKLFDMLEDLDDVQNVYSNADFSDAVMAELE